MQILPIRRALLSVSDKTGLAEFARQLVEQNVELYSTGGTRRVLEEHGLEVVDVASYTGFPEMMDGRVKTLHPKIFGGILGRADHEQDLASMADHGILSFELVVVNLYPFEETIAKAETTRDEAVEKIDIGGPSLVRAAAKNHRYITISTSPKQYRLIAEQLVSQRGTDFALRRQLMVEAFQHTARYDRAIADYFECELSGDETSAPSDESPSAPQRLQLSLKLKDTLRYGENPHQVPAGVYQIEDSSNASNESTLVAGNQLNGKALSYNNLLDLDAAWGIARRIKGCGVAVIKHNNPCGAASHEVASEAMKAAMEGDPLSAFGSVLATNFEVDEMTAEYLATPGLFVEAIAAPSFTEQALTILTTKPKWRNNVRLISMGVSRHDVAPLQLRCVDGGVLVQPADSLQTDVSSWETVTTTQLTGELEEELLFGWDVCRYVKSNAITVSNQRRLCGVGAGQMSRVDSVEIALNKAGDRSRGGVLASDAFFPFPDSIARAAEAGISAIVQPGGSKNDPAVIDACNQHGIAMAFTRRRHFKH